MTGRGQRFERTAGAPALLAAAAGGHQREARGRQPVQRQRTRAELARQVDDAALEARRHRRGDVGQQILGHRADALADQVGRRQLAGLVEDGVAVGQRRRDPVKPRARAAR
ncbi:MAG: hypothetical protein QM674_24355 [Burkholderiaceae bacterium]